MRDLANLIEVEPGVPLMSHANWQRIEKREQPYAQHHLETLAKVLKCAVSDLLTVDPSKDGEVVDLVRMVNANRDTRDRAIRILKALNETEQDESE